MSAKPNPGFCWSEALSSRGVLAIACAIVLGCLCAAPTPGDIGGCQPARDLDEGAFFAAKRNVDCGHCTQCGIEGSVCSRACKDERAQSDRFPEHCAPLAHDGAVCLRALDDADCSAYRSFVAEDESRTLPTECDFCPFESMPAADGGNR
jgi:hypothetical protein